MRAAIAIRVSPRPADRVRYSPEIQESKCREWCEQNGHEVVTVIRDILVSGGAVDRFTSIFAALDQYAVELFVVSDLSRWTRDEPEMFWYVKKVLSDRGVTLASVDEPWLDSDIPFSATVTTAKVEANYQERLVLREKTSAGIRAAKASGKSWWRHFGWAWNASTRRYDYDSDKIRALYEAWVRGDPATQIGRRFGMHTSHVKRAIRAVGQRPIVGDDLWLAAQARLPARGPRNDAKRGNAYRGLLACPFCGHNLQRPSSANQPFSYGCVDALLGGVEHDWRFLDIRRSVIPSVRSALSRLVVPESEIAAASGAPPAAPDPERDYAAEIERLTMAWVKGRIPDERYEKAVAAIEAERDRPAPPPPPVEYQVEIARFAEIADLETQDVEQANALNRVLREALTVTILADKDATVTIREPYSVWAMATD